MSSRKRIKLCRMCPFRIGILDKNGDTLTVYPFKAEAVGNFSGYDVVVQTLKNRKINQQKFFLQDGSQMYIICVPLFHEKDLAGNHGPEPERQGCKKSLGPVGKGISGH